MSSDEYVTDMVATWLISESEFEVHEGVRARIAEHACRYAQRADTAGLCNYVTGVLKHPHRHNSAVREVHDELAPNDYDRIDWNEVAEALKASNG